MARKYCVHASNNPATKRRVMAADEDFDSMDFSGDIDNVDDSFSEQLDDVADVVEDIQETVEDDDEDTVNIEIENNIEGHYIAECDKCGGIFISATVESDQDVEKVVGECPLCGEESDQYLKWVVHKVTRLKQDDIHSSTSMKRSVRNV